MLTAVDRTEGRRVSPPDVMADVLQRWNLICPTCSRPVHLVRRRRRPYFAHEVGVPATACVLRNVNPSGPSYRWVSSPEVPLAGAPLPVEEPRPWRCPDCGQSAAETSSTGEPNTCIVCGELVCSECYNDCECCGEAVCDDCDHGKWECATCGDEFCDHSEEGGREDQYQCACRSLHCPACVADALEPCVECQAKACAEEECDECGERVCGRCIDEHHD